MIDNNFDNKQSDMLTDKERKEIMEYIKNIPDMVKNLYQHAVGQINSAMNQPNRTTQDENQIYMISPASKARFLQNGQYVVGYDPQKGKLFAFEIDEAIVQNIYVESHRSNLIGSTLDEAVAMTLNGDVPGAFRPLQFGLELISVHSPEENMERLGRKPQPPIDGTLVCLPNQSQISKILGIKEDELVSHPGFLALGDGPYSAEGELIPLGMTEEDHNMHLLILGQSGRGKTVLLKSITKDLHDKNYAILATDTQGDLAGMLWRDELHSSQLGILKDRNMKEMWDARGWSEDSIGINPDNIRIFVLNDSQMNDHHILQVIRNHGHGNIIQQLNLRSSNIGSYVELATAMGNLSIAQVEGLESYFRLFMDGDDDKPRSEFNLREFIEYIEDHESIRGVAPTTRDKLIQKLDNLAGRGILDVGTDPTAYTSYSDLMSKGVVSILFLPNDIPKVKISKTLVKLIVFNIIADHQLDTENMRRAIIIDEGQSVIPRSSSASNRVESLLVERFDDFATQGRKFGLSLIVASQEPRKIHPTVFSQCSSKVLLGLSSNDIDDISREIPRNKKDFLLNAKRGQGLFVTNVAMERENADLIFPIAPIYHVDPRIMIREEGITTNMQSPNISNIQDVGISSDSRSEEETDEY